MIENKQKPLTFNTDELSQYLGVDRRTILRWRKEGRMPPPIREDANGTIWLSSTILAWQGAGRPSDKEYTAQLGMAVEEGFSLLSPLEHLVDQFAVFLQRQEHYQFGIMYPKIDKLRTVLSGFRKQLNFLAGKVK